jgi:hypothetical protein
MEINSSILKVIIILFFVAVILIVAYLPRFIIKLRAHKFGLELSLSDAHIIQNCQCANNDFFKDAMEIRELIDISIIQLATHELSSGDLTNVKNGIIELKKRGKDVDISTLFAIDLAGKDIQTEIVEAEEIRSIVVDSLRNKILKIDYYVTYKYDFPNSVFTDKKNEIIVQKIKTKLETFLKDWSETNVFKTESFIRENILSNDFWERELRGLIVKQEYKIETIGGNTT